MENIQTGVFQGSILEHGLSRKSIVISKAFCTAWSEYLCEWNWWLEKDQTMGSSMENKFQSWSSCQKHFEMFLDSKLDFDEYIKGILDKTS